jgi:hypothetical protein
LQKFGPRQLNDQLTKGARNEAKPRRQKIVFFINMIAAFVFSSYSLFEAYWAEDVLVCSVGCNWLSYQESPGMFRFAVSFYSFLFLLSGYALIASVRRKMTGK